MREFTTPAPAGPPASGGLADSLYDTAERTPGLVQLARRDGDDQEWRGVTAAAFRDEVLALAKGLLTRGVRYGDRVALMSRTRYEWTLFDYALWSVGAIPVPVYPTAAPEQVRWILAETQAVACLVEDEDHAMTVGAVCDALPDLTGIWQLDRGCVAAITEDGRGVPDSLVHRQRLGVAPGNIATVVYTSGTTGRPKGCLLTHANLAAAADAMLDGWGDVFQDTGGAQPSTLLFLPLAHVYGRLVQVAAVRGGFRIGHIPEVATEVLLPALASYRPTFLHVVPYVFDKIFQRARRAAEESGRGELFEQARQVAVEWAAAREQRALGHGPGPGPKLRLRHLAYERTVYQRLRAVLGGRVRGVMCGGSSLGRELGLFFTGIGLDLYEGYGLTETSAAITANPARRQKLGTVGRPVPGATVAIADDGEVWVRGPGVFDGYLNHPQCTAAALYDGWLGTGDLGSLDEDGYLTITGRKKDLIVTSSGKNLAPSSLEERVQAHPLVSQCLVVGDDRPYVAALITLDPAALAHWLKSHGREQLDPWAALADEELHAEIQRAVGAANTAVSRAESIRAFRLLPREFDVDQGLLTPSLKLRRAAITEYYGQDIEELYAP
ncbi:AMP-dependent synthetase/ligase [Streptomyces sp. CB01881]|uniref:AMP-dependent synthetase/ligase n=1 Tax=Streptomyces sp. CB01881 TaxID=2078691 RepID=UPI000CDBCC38|nr:AMP-dependent synthetase/ligase [Streptomyces sp. CB01881]AUY48937.1 long-chain fatty acid--CoA ligase [Streptomyces sp. CB01881]TYC77425.1 long-chain fatty acid--CoA ligase [Streptomyces sp. CB01881]